MLIITDYESGEEIEFGTPFGWDPSNFTNEFTIGYNSDENVTSIHILTETANNEYIRLDGNFALINAEYDRNGNERLHITLANADEATPGLTQSQEQAVRMCFMAWEAMTRFMVWKE